MEGSTQLRKSAELREPAQTSTTSGRRLPAVDALRALALLGILSVNVWFFAHPEALTGEMSAGVPETTADQLVRFTSTLLFEGKSYVLFSFLFGLSFVLAWARAYETGADDTRRAVRRFLALILLGVLHGIFLFAGDILLAYGILGFLLLGLRRISAKAALITAGIIYAVVATGLVLLGWMTMVLADAGTFGGGAPPTFGEASAYTDSVGSYLGFQLPAWVIAQSSVLLIQGPLALAAFLLGLTVGRTRLIERILDGGVRTSRMLACGLPALLLGLLLSALGAALAWGVPGTGTPAGAEYGETLMGTALAVAAGPIQSFGYVVLLLVLFRSAAGAPLARALAPAGRASLSNYLGQSLVLMLIFAAPGLALAGQLPAAAVGAVVLGLWTVQLLASHLWFRRFRRGPLEAPLRAWTYRGGQRQHQPEG